MISHKIKFALVTLLSLSTLVSSVSACVIETGPSPALSNYLSKLDKALADISSASSGASCSNTSDGKTRASDSLSRSTSEIVKNTNRALTQDDYMSAGRFSIDLVLRGEVPTALRRDYNLLLRKQEAINSLIDSIYANCGSDLDGNTSIIDDPSYTTGKSDQTNLWTLAGDLLTNHIKIIGFYREATIGVPPTKANFLMVDDDFESSLSADYGPKWTEICNKKWDPFKRVTEAIDRIGDLGGSIARGTDDWKAAWALLQSNSTEYSQVERGVLARELSRQWLSGKSSSLILRNLAYYNKTDQHRGISGFVEDIGDRVNQGFSAVNEAFGGLREDLGKAKDTDQYLDRYQNIQAVRTDIGKEITGDFYELMDHIGDENLTTDEITGHLADIYNEIDTTTKLISPYRKVARDTCNQQTQNSWGNCSGK